MASQESYISFQISSGGFNGRELYYYKITPTYTEVKVQFIPFTSRESVEKIYKGAYEDEAFRYLEEKTKKCFEVNPDDIFSGRIPFEPSIAKTIDLQLYNTQKFILGKWLPWMKHAVHQIKGLDSKIHMDYKYILDYVEDIKRQALLHLPSFHFSLEDEKNSISAIRVNGFLLWTMDENTPPTDLAVLESEAYFIEVFQRLEGEAISISTDKPFHKLVLEGDTLHVQ